MKNKLLKTLSIAGLLLMSVQIFAQAPTLGTAADFVLFSTVGAVGNTGTSQITGNVGTNSGAITGFGNVNGVMHTSNGATGQCAADLLIAYNQLNSTVPDFFPGNLLGNGQIFGEGVYSIQGDASLDNDLSLDAQNDPDAVFIVLINGENTFILFQVFEQIFIALFFLHRLFLSCWCGRRCGALVFSLREAVVLESHETNTQGEQNEFSIHILGLAYV
jgi:hypothetical protein